MANLAIVLRILLHRLRECALPAGLKPRQRGRTLMQRLQLGRAESFTPEKLIIGVLTTGEQASRAAEENLTASYGRIDYRSQTIPFTFTDYYRPEMGASIDRYFITFEQPVDPQRLADIKLHTNRIEEELSAQGRRSINLDPGLLSLGKLILASTKDNAQRIPLRDGIYAEVTLVYRSGAYQPLPWTFRDYAGREYRAIFGEIRENYKQQLRG